MIVIKIIVSFLFIPLILLIFLKNKTQFMFTVNNASNYRSEIVHCARMGESWFF